MERSEAAVNAVSVYIRPIRHSVRTAPAPAGNNLIYRARAKRVTILYMYDRASEAH